MCPNQQAPLIDRRAPDGHTPETCFKLLSVQEAMDTVNQQLHAGGVRMSLIEARIKDVLGIIEKGAAAHARAEADLKANTEATSELLEIVSMGKGFFKTTAVLGRVLKWGLGIATAIIAFMVALKSGKTL